MRLSRFASLVLMVIPLALPVGTITHASDEIETNTQKTIEIELTEFNSNIVSVSANDLNLEVVKKPEPIPEPKPKPVVAVKRNTYLPEPDSAGKRALAKIAAATYGIDWKILEAVWQVESGKSWYRNVRSYAGATGPCQFMPGTWRGYAVDGNGDGIKDITYAPDCLFGSARLLAANGANIGDNARALFAYNHSTAYVNKVLAIANSY